MILGTRLYGRTDEVEGLGYVAASFFHVNFVPLIPTGETYLVTKHSFFSERQEVVRIKNDRRPVVLGYARGLAWTVAVLTSLFALLNVAFVVSTGRFHLGPELPAFLGACVALTLLYAPHLRKASPERAWELSAESGVGAIEIADLLVDAPARAEDVRRVAEGARQVQEASGLREKLQALPKRTAPRIQLARALPTSTPDAVKFECPTCGHASKVSVEHVGRKGLCKACGLALRVPAPIAKRARALVEWSWSPISEEPQPCPRRKRTRPSRPTRPQRPQPPPAVLGWRSSDAPLGLAG
jgi:predicted RNA-binding Zn-ribbon protein involved in translation (DUF1610 family)